MGRQEELAGVNEGDVLAEKYRVDKVLGIGGMGVVVAAHHIHLDDKVAIKFLLPETLSNADAVMRFSREARAAVKIKSEHVARVTDVGTLSSGAPYMVMEYLEGGDLSAWLEQNGRLPTDTAVDYVLQACEALAEAHALGIVHRDLKPANLFLAKLPGGVQTIKVLDFGISKLTGLSASGGDSSQTKTAALMGSPLYMSPEQMRASKDVDTRGDIWAIGTILYELVTGGPPFVADTMPELILKIMEAAPQALGDAPHCLEQVILRCLEKDRNERYQTVGELAVALAPFGTRKARASVERIGQVMQAAGMSVSLRSLPPPSTPQARAGSSTRGAFGTTAAGAPAPPRWVFALAGVVVFFSGVLAVALGRRHSSDPASSSAASAVPSAPAVPVLSPPAPPAWIPARPVVAPALADKAAVAPSTAVPPAPPAVSGAARIASQAARRVAASRSRVSPPPVAPAPRASAPAPRASAPPVAPTIKSPAVDSLLDDRQ